MSLILDALRKLDREKDAREPGVVVVGSVPWGRPQRSSFPIALATAAAGLVVLAAAGWWLLRPAPPPKTAPATAVPAPGAGPVESLPLPGPVPTPAAAEVAPPPRRAPLPEPMRTPEAPAAVAPAAHPPAPAEPLADTAAPDGLRLQAIAERDGHPVALINDRLVREGDSFDGVTVVRIGTAEVEIEVRGQRRVLRF